MRETDKLRALLDGRGVKYKCGTGPANVDTVTIWKGQHGRRCIAFEEQMEGGLRVQSIVTPEQAVDATLGRGECEMRSAEGSFCSVNRPVYHCECGAFCTDYTDATTYHKPRYCPNCRRKVKR